MGWTILGDLVVGLILLIAADIWRDQRREKKKRRMYYVKVDCMIYALRSINHGIGSEFGEAYDQRFEEMKREKEFIDS